MIRHRDRDLESDVEDQEALGSETKIDVTQVCKRPQEEPTPGQQDERECDLSDDEQRVEPLAGVASSITAGHEGCDHPGPRRVPGRHEPEQDHGRRGERNNEHQHARVDGRLDRERRGFV